MSKGPWVYVAQATESPTVIFSDAGIKIVGKGRDFLAKDGYPYLWRDRHNKQWKLAFFGSEAPRLLHDRPR